jgi:hypothetical protein
LSVLPGLASLLLDQSAENAIILGLNRKKAIAEFWQRQLGDRTPSRMNAIACFAEHDIAASAIGQGAVGKQHYIGIIISPIPYLF